MEIKPVQKNSIGEWYNILPSNGYFGAVDPMPYLENIYALEFAGLWKRVKELMAIVSDFLGDKLRK